MEHLETGRLIQFFLIIKTFLTLYVNNIYNLSETLTTYHKNPRKKFFPLKIFSSNPTRKIKYPKN